jgi:D-galactarolactone cycloisomerase
VRIRTVDFFALDAPLAAGRAYGMSKALATGRQTTVVKLGLEDGTIGYGEAWGLPAVNLAYVPFLRSYLLGASVFDCELVFARMLARHYHFGVQNQMMACLSGIDMAAKDAAGKLLDLPACRLIGGRGRERVPIYASGGYITENPDRDFEPQIAAMAEAGYPAVKIKIGLSPESDERRVAIARDMLGDGVDIMADINSNYTCDLARESIDRMAPYRVGWVEEPLSPLDFEGLEILHGASPLPLAAGEALYTVFDFKRLTDRRVIDVLQPDLSLCGGFWQGRKIADLAVMSHVRLSPHVWGSGIGLAAAVHYVAALPPWPHADNVPKPSLVEYDVGENPLRFGVLREPLAAEDGFIAVPDGPGLGIEVDEEAFERYAAT